MIFRTKDGLFSVDLEYKTVRQIGQFGPKIFYHIVAAVYVGSPGAVFYGPDWEILLQTGPVTEILGEHPVEQVTAEPGNMLVLTLNSAYEIDEAGKRIRRLAGLNKPASRPDGEWINYREIIHLREGWAPVVIYSPEKGKKLSAVRRIDHVPA